jgi:CBS domain-containing protein
MRVAELMSRGCCGSSPQVVEAAELMRDHDIGFLPVTASDVVVGVETDYDLIVRAISKGLNPPLTPVRSVMSTDPIWCYEDDVLTER